MLVYENRAPKMNFFWCQGIFFTWTLIQKMAAKMNLRRITKNHAADPEKGFLAESISKPNGRATAMPTAWELTFRSLKLPNHENFRIGKIFCELCPNNGYWRSSNNMSLKSKLYPEISIYLRSFNWDIPKLAHLRTAHSTI